MHSLHLIDFDFRYFFAKKFQHIVEAAAAKKPAGLVPLPSAANHTKSWLKRLITFITGSPMVVVDADVVDRQEMPIRRLTPDMIRRMDEPPKPINPNGKSSGWVREHHPSRRTIPSGSPTPESFEEFPSNRGACRSASPDSNPKKCVTRLIIALWDTSPIYLQFYQQRSQTTIGSWPNLLYDLFHSPKKLIPS